MKDQKYYQKQREAILNDSHRKELLALPITFLRLAHVAAYQHQSSIEKQNFNEPQQ